jgi:hypothetical protein
VLYNVITLLHRQLDHRGAGEIPNYEQPGDIAFIVGRELGTSIRPVGGSEQMLFEPGLHRFEHPSLPRS